VFRKDLAGKYPPALPIIGEFRQGWNTKIPSGLLAFPAGNCHARSKKNNSEETKPCPSSRL